MSELSEGQGAIWEIDRGVWNTRLLIRLPSINE
jgi:hypothetical protein